MTDPTSAAPSSASPPPPGWYPDGSGAQRWWDGRGWTDYRAAPAAPIAAPRERPTLPHGTKTDGVWIWLAVVLPIAGTIPLFFFDYVGYMNAIYSTAVTGSGSGLSRAVAGFFVYIIVTIVISWTAYGFTVFSSFRDYRSLVALGVERPFHWAFAFLSSLVYVIGRHVILRKVTRASGAPLWVLIGLWVTLFIATMVWSIWLTGQLLNSIPYWVYDGYDSFS